jgi:hypothetical protein
VTREVLRSAGVPCQMFDALPLAAESWAAAFDLVCSAVGTGFARGPAIALLGSPHFRFEDGGERLGAADVTALDRALAEHGYLGQLSALRPLVEAWTATSGRRRARRGARRAGRPACSSGWRRRSSRCARRRRWPSISGCSSPSSPGTRRRRARTIRCAAGSCARARPCSAR